MKQGDEIVVVKHGDEDYGETFKIINPYGNENYTEYIGHHITALGKNGNSRVLLSNEYKLKEDNENNVDIEKFDVITLNNKDENTKRLFYQVIDTREDEVAFINDYGYIHWIDISECEKANLKNWIDYFNDLQEQVNNVRDRVNEIGNIVIADIREGLNRLN